VPSAVLVVLVLDTMMHRSAAFSAASVAYFGLVDVDTRTTMLNDDPHDDHGHVRYARLACAQEHALPNRVARSCAGGFGSLAPLPALKRVGVSSSCCLLTPLLNHRGRIRVGHGVHLARAASG
jgi:hypothetical protein